MAGNYGAACLGISPVHFDASCLRAVVGHRDGATFHREVAVNLHAHATVRVFSIFCLSAKASICSDGDVGGVVVFADGQVAIGLDAT